MNGWSITDPRVFFGIASAIVAYVLYMMIRKRKGLRPGYEKSEPEL